MQFAGTIDLPLPRAEVWSKLMDMRCLAASLPDLAAVGEVTDDRAECTVRPGFSFARGKLATTIERTEMKPQESISFRMSSKGVGSTSELLSRLELAEADENTQVRWTAEISNLGGLLKAVPKGLIQGAAQKTIEQTWNNLAQKIKEGGADIDSAQT